MSCCSENKPAEHKRINADLRRQAKAEQEAINLLLLGAGDSGKSTLFKQMRLMHVSSWTEDEKQDWIPIIHSNLVIPMRTLVKKCAVFKYTLSKKSKKYMEQLQDPEGIGGLTPFVTKDNKEIITGLWKDKAIQKTWDRRNEYQINDSAIYFFESIDRIATEDYLPSEDDILRARVTTTGINELEFSISGNKFRLIDVGGQKSQRRKWIHQFQDVNFLLFVTSLSEYDQKLLEDEDKNRAEDSLELFDHIVNSEWFEKTPVIIFFNKKDIFAEKLQKHPLTVGYPDYQGDNSFESATEYITELFSSKINSPMKKVHAHITCATDTDHIQVVFGAVQDIILQAILGSVVSL